MMSRKARRDPTRPRQYFLECKITRQPSFRALALFNVHVQYGCGGQPRRVLHLDVCCSVAVCHCIDVTILIHACMQHTSIHSIIVNAANGVEMRQQQRRGRSRPIAHKWRSDGSSFITSHGNRQAMSLTIQKLVYFINILFEMWSPR